MKYLITTTKNKSAVVKAFAGETWGANLHSARTHWEGLRYITINPYNVETDHGVVTSVRFLA